MGARDLARRFKVGPAAYRVYHGPRRFALRCAAEGPVNLWLSDRGRKAMERAAAHLPRVGHTPGPGAAAVYFLTGAKFWYQTAFCAYSLLRNGAPVRVVVIDDGSLTAEHADRLGRVISGLEVVRGADVEQRLEADLPASRFPALRARRLVYPHLRKLTDVHAGSRGWKLVLDSDMLFFRPPAFLTDWLAAPDRPCHATDTVTSYGYSAGLMAELAGGPVPDRVNVGVCGLRSDAIDWDRVEHWCRVMSAREGNHYLQEQALTALLVAGRSCAVAPASDYLVLPGRAEAERPAAVMHHYVAESKAWYFRFGWRRVAAGGGE